MYIIKGKIFFYWKFVKDNDIGKHIVNSLDLSKSVNEIYDDILHKCDNTLQYYELRHLHNKTLSLHNTYDDLRVVLDYFDDNKIDDMVDVLRHKEIPEISYDNETGKLTIRDGIVTHLYHKGDKLCLKR